MVAVTMAPATMATATMATATMAVAASAARQISFWSFLQFQQPLQLKGSATPAGSIDRLFVSMPQGFPDLYME